MRFYGNQFGSSYEELISYYPRYYRDLLEMVAILNAQGKLLDDAKAQIEQNYLNNFIEYMDEAAISDLEEFLEIHNDGTKTLDERKKIVKPYFAGFGRISSTTIKEMIAAYSDATADVRLEPFDEAGNNMLYIDLTCGQDATVLINDVLNMLSKKIPAHIMYRLFLRYTSSAAHSYIGAGYHGTAQRVAVPIVGKLCPRELLSTTYAKAGLWGIRQQEAARIAGTLRPKDHKAVTYAPAGCAAYRMQMAAYIKGDIRPADHTATAPAPVGVAAFRQQIEIKIGGNT